MARPQNRKKHCADEALQDNPPAKRPYADEASQGDPPAKGRNRQHADEPSRDDDPPARRLRDDPSSKRRADELSRDPPAKRIKSASGPRGHSNFPPAFWDNLSKVWLTRRALRELDRRYNSQPPPEPTAPEVYSSDLARFARHGGPDLRHLRGCPEPKHAAHTMASSRSSASSSRRTKSTKSTNPTTAFSKAGRSSAYDDGFEQHLIDHNIYLPLYKLPGNRRAPKPDLDDTRHLLSVSRPSLSPSRFDDSAFEDFQQKIETRSEGTVMRNVIPIIAGNSDIPNEGHLPFTNFTSLTEEAIVKPVPDYFDGARPGDVDRAVGRSLSQIIIPTKHADVPVAPNFFLEAKAPKGGADARRQACYDGAYGARAMNSLQNYGEDEPAYDDNAYTYSSTYHACTGTLQLYAHHVTAPTTAGGRPQCHMTQLKAYALTSDRESFVQGATAFRNARDLAEQHRDRFIQTANARARGEVPSAAEDDLTGTTEIQQDERHES